jgi:hypothetical protein
MATRWRPPVAVPVTVISVASVMPAVAVTAVMTAE